MATCAAMATRAVNHVPLKEQRKYQEPRVKVTQEKAMTKTEAEFFARLRCLHDNVRAHCVRLKLGLNTTYTPDFMVILPGGGIHFHEVKGSWKMPHQDDSRVKIKLAATLYPEFKFFAAVKVPEKKGGGWELEEFRP